MEVDNHQDTNAFMQQQMFFRIITLYQCRYLRVFEGFTSLLVKEVIGSHVQQRLHRLSSLRIDSPALQSALIFFYDLIKN
jgi:hypothetical protein